jgi:hypothetical protein
MHLMWKILRTNNWFGTLKSKSAVNLLFDFFFSLGLWTFLNLWNSRTFVLQRRLKFKTLNFKKEKRFWILLFDFFLDLFRFASERFNHVSRPRIELKLNFLSFCLQIWPYRSPGGSRSIWIISSNSTNDEYASNASRMYLMRKLSN